ncbi:MAG TPA: nitrogenase component 1, partial [Methanothrix sp.]|nr:nitrogenase component 1 [Methanothrix sp.]
SRGDFFAGLIIGGLIGAGIALLFAPQSGEETRAFLKEKALELKEKAEQIILRETARVMPQIECHRSRVSGKKAAIYMGGAAKAISLVRAFQELGMDVVIIGTQTGDRDDYQRIGYIVKDGTLIIDDANPLELKELLLKQSADLLVAGVKERFLAYKLGIAFCDFNHDRTINFEGFQGMANFAREIDITINSPVWRLSVKRQSPINSRSDLTVDMGVGDAIKETCQG